MRWCAGRRALLAGAGAAGAAGLLAACGDDPAPSGAAAAPATSAPVTAAPATSLASTADVPVGGGTLVGGVLLVQPVAGTFKAYDAACPHKGVKIGAPKDGVATCPAHNSTFAIADGARLSGPATSGLKEIPIKVEAGQITEV
ncbi:Rieske (2Fe-2S) protein [Dactylosporangium aurantiacum]|uniref:Rieske (2Fe-2S) protein n=1 Tax=Dactylosporangium aurantiacum TaxID=35754 RepID=A0A9Q9INS9_9ACTN|nr:Rieske (2Fe-2S) protein [Dactylosporangium aurantiacum]MDG6107768.1 Rieske (2Fe-2S) protein [Dactylosporangium aurantiacum]UWZ59579.1 Rieske (2Fe-2S) protein [Dactylosporangium aurantiacum]